MNIARINLTAKVKLSHKTHFAEIKSQKHKMNNAQKKNDYWVMFLQSVKCHASWDQSGKQKIDYMNLVW